MFANSEAARKFLVQALELDLIGPSNDHEFARELLPHSPRNWYLTGMLVPVDSKIEAKEDPAAHEDLDEATPDAGADDGGTPDKPPTRRGYFPSSMGMSFLVKPGVDKLMVRLEWGEYEFEERGAPTDEPEAAEEEVREGGAAQDSNGRGRSGYRRSPHAFEIALAIPTGQGANGSKATEVPIVGTSGMLLTVVARKIDPTRVKSLPVGTRSVSLFLVNRRESDDRHPHRVAVFQPRIVLPDAGVLVPRSDLRGDATGAEWDDKVADLQYRDSFEFAVGHGVSVRTTERKDGGKQVETAWIPRATVERVEPANLHGGVMLSMERLAALPDGAAAAAALDGLGVQYSEWIERQKSSPGLTKQQAKTLADLTDNQRAALQRIRDGIASLTDPKVMMAFQIANRTMAMQARQRMAVLEATTPSAVKEPEWRPFQLAFILMGLRGIVDPKHADRETVDLLFFPTGGGKTEAYLGLAAFTLALRRLRDPSIASAGVAVLMRYTLRLLTLDQLGRAAALICALELERAKAPETLGTHPFEIGLWVGRGATPNRMGERQAKKAPPSQTALARTLDYRDGRSKTPPIPLEACPWCGTPFARDSFFLAPDLNRPRNLHILCVNRQCEFTGARPLPIVAVDEPLYRRLPCFVISTVDKFAALPWTAEVGQLLGRVDRYDANDGDGFAFSRGGAGVPVRLQPPELIIQDELHLISGPLGTVAGIYEGAIDELATREKDGKRIRPKIVASTATVRRAEAQIRALFDRSSVTVFPPAGPDRRDSFFAVTKLESDVPGRLYVGVAAQGRSMKVVFLRTLMALFAAGQRGYEEAKRGPENPMDPYMTIVGYFNSLRELGGSRRIAEDELTLKLKNPPRQRLEPADDYFRTRAIQQDPLELTSRVETDKVAEAKHRLGLHKADQYGVDLALATNMISVGLDITRLGLMVVLGQPKGSSEYIQATSRVGRDRSKPGLVVTLLNAHKPRDRSHYERFESYHHTFYRSVEATSVTPSAPRALDRALAPAIVGLVRQMHPEFHPNSGAKQIRKRRSELDVYAKILANRAKASAPPGEEDKVYQQVLTAATLLLDKWHMIAEECVAQGTELNYEQSGNGGDRLLREVLDPALATMPKERAAFRTPRSMRDVEASVDLVIPGM